MTEAEWLACNDPELMLEFVLAVSKRKQRLLLVGCCRNFWDLFSDWGRRPVEVAERFADGQATTKELEEARWLADSNSCEEDGLHQQAVSDRGIPGSPEGDELLLHEVNYHRDRLLVAMLAHTSTFPDEWLDHRELLIAFKPWEDTAGLMRCVVGNPFRPVTVDPAWLTSTVVSLATAIYDDRAFDRLPILADALEDAGCTHADLLNHCRQPGEHARGCWPVDLLLGKQ